MKTLENLMESLTINQNTIINSLFDPIGFYDGNSGYSIEDGVYDLFDNGNYLDLFFATFDYQIFYTNGAIMAYQNLNNWGRYFTIKI